MLQNNRISPMKKDPKKRTMQSMKSVAQRLLDKPAAPPRMGKK